MIISDDLKFVFVHIPKCAGTSIGHALKPIDTTGLAFFDIADHSVLGRLHLKHLTLRELEEHFPTAFSKVARYRSMAVVRDPVDRFYSGVFQRLRYFKRVPQSAITPQVVDSEAKLVIDYLDARPPRLDFDHAHFNRQSDFLELDGERIVTDVFPLSRLAEAFAHVRKLTAIEIGQEKLNSTTELRFALLKPIQKVLRRHYARLIPADARARVRENMTRAGFYKSVPKDQFVGSGRLVEHFVRDYYARDFEIVAGLETARGGAAT